LTLLELSEVVEVVGRTRGMTTGAGTTTCAGAGAGLARATAIAPRAAADAALLPHCAVTAVVIAAVRGWVSAEVGSVVTPALSLSRAAMTPLVSAVLDAACASALSYLSV
jgi:hypothetical protein